jgi:RraA family protein
MPQPDWTDAPTGLISDCRNRLGVMSSCISRMAGGRLAGPAFTVETVAGENGTIHRALAHAPAGSVLVVDAGGYADRAVWGGILSLAARGRGIAGVVIDGAVRDIDEIRELELPLFARATSPAGPHKGWQGRFGHPISCGGVTVAPGDVVVGDADGVVVVPAGEVTRIATDVAERLALEASWRDRIEAGESTASMLGLEPIAEE